MFNIVTKCDGCDKVERLIPFDNRRNYCLKCAEEIEAMGWAKRIKDIN